ncbi:NAD(P)-dependent oxidoreductase [Jhaorihella thermophila]|uniref:Glutamate synthase (NADPH/NADH) small chain n=1 Tax=Jhaorihella thermophila TaxID=488547 RepID=A0A1H5W1T1_9RHOB|nr:NAD(P)-dependent oxidoreductase [Jhaorihella thermophila]SEF93091.1 glutamate synthase (NADPH/NADH) small chain [Jhaorihella thermophila]
MPDGVHAPGITTGRLPKEQIEANFGDLHPPLSPHEAAVAADRCYFCHDAPCVAACPTEIDIPLFIRQIQAGNPKGAARTILSQNILGGMCARVCPTETLCEADCVRNTAEERPVEIGRLQRFATDTLMAGNEHPFTRAAPTGRRVAVVGAGPAGLACAHRLAMHGHDVTIFEARDKPGGLNEFGIAAYKTVDGFAAREVDWLLQIGGITVRTGQRLGDGLTLEALLGSHDAVFLGVGLGGVHALGIPGEDLPGVRDAVDFIADLRQARDLSALPVGRDVVVIGGGMTAVDAAVQSKLLGAENVTIAYRRGREEMPASRYEQDLAASKGVRLMFNVRPTRILGDGAVQGVELEYTDTSGGRVEGTGEHVTLVADQVLKAIGQTLDGAPEGVEVTGGKIAVTGAGRTSRDRVWAGGDCVAGGEDLTVTAVTQGRDAAEDIHASLTA